MSEILTSIAQHQVTIKQVFCHSLNREKGQNLNKLALREKKAQTNGLLKPQTRDMARQDPPQEPQADQM